MSLSIAWCRRLFAANRIASAICFSLAVAVVFPEYACGQDAAGAFAPGFTQVGKQQRIVILPIDVKLYNLSMAGSELREDWTAAAARNIHDAIAERATRLGATLTTLSEAEADRFAEQMSLAAAVANSIAFHHARGGVWKLPTKEGRLDWTFGDAMQPLQARTGARYGLFVWVRDSYASAERKAAIIGLALLGAHVDGGVQTGHASLVDLESGRVVWFNRLTPRNRDLREPGPAAECIETLMAGFPEVR